MTYREIILSVPVFKPEQYAHIGAGDYKYGACAAYYLKEKGVPLTMNYLGIAMFKMFPDLFYCDVDFKEYPSLDRLNREICMHMTITKKKEDAILAGSAKKGFQLTKYGEFLGKQIYESIIKGLSEGVNARVKENVDSHKEGPSKEYYDIKNSAYFLEFTKTGQISKNAVWKLFKVIPFTQETTIKKKIKLAEAKALECNDTEVLEFLKRLLMQLE